MSARRFERPVVVFDGECRFCTGTANWLAAHLQRPAEFVPWQRADLAALGLTSEQARQAVWWVEPEGLRVHSERAIAQALISCGMPWRALGRLIGTPGIRSLAALAYRWVARHRGRLPGPTAACRHEPPD